MGDVLFFWSMKLDVKFDFISLYGMILVIDLVVVKLVYIMYFFIRLLDIIDDVLCFYFLCILLYDIL